MKYVIASIALIGILASCGGDKKEVKEKEAVDTTAKVQPRKVGELKIAFYHQDSIASQFEYYRVADSTIKVKSTRLENEIKRQEDAYRSWAAGKDRDAQNGLLSQVDLENLQIEAQNRQQKIGAYTQTESEKLQNETMAEMTAIGKKIETFSSEYCAANNIDILLVHGAGGQLTFIHDSMNVTAEFVAYLNQAQEKLLK